MKPRVSFVFQEGIEPAAAGNDQDIERRGFVKGQLRGEDQAIDVPEGFAPLREDMEGGVRQAAEDFERAGEIDLIEAGEDNGAEGEVGGVRVVRHDRGNAVIP